MSTVMKLPAIDPQVVEVPPPPQPRLEPILGVEAPWDAAGFANQQVRALVQEVFFPGRPRAARHVAFMGVEENTYVAEICIETAQVLAAQVAGSICVIEANPHHPELEEVFWRKDSEPSAASGEPGLLRTSCQRLADNLWLAPLRLLLDADEAALSASVLGRRLSDFRLEFEYTILHSPPPGAYCEGALLGYLCDGAILVLEANRTRRVAAQRAKESLASANARVLGAALTERTFPIPEGIYRRL
jgi:hypothetical protein